MTQEESDTIQKLAHYSWTISLQEELIDQLDLKDINKKTGAKCWVDDISVNRCCKVLEITGKDEKSVAMAQQIIQRLLRKFRRQNSGAEGGNTSAMGARSGDSGERLSESIVSEEDETSAPKKEEKYASNLENEDDVMDDQAREKRKRCTSSESSASETDSKENKSKKFDSKVKSKKGKKHETSWTSWNVSDESSDDEQERLSNIKKENMNKSSRPNSFSDLDSKFSMPKKKCKREQESDDDTTMFAECGDEGDDTCVFPPNGSNRNSDGGETNMFAECDDEKDMLSDSDNEKEVHSDSDDIDLPDLPSSYESDSSWNFENFWENNNMDADLDSESEEESEEKKKEEERKERIAQERERFMELREVNSWIRNNLWGRRGSNVFSVGSAPCLVSPNTGKIDIQQLAMVGTTFFKQFKEQVASENYDTWKKQSGDQWRNRMRSAHKEMEKNLCKAVAYYSSGLYEAAAAGDVVSVRSLARNLLVSYGYLAPRVKESCRMDVYSQALNAFKKALDSAGGDTDKSWLSGTGARKGLVDLVVDMIDEVSTFLPTMQVDMREIVKQSERFVGKLDKWTSVEEEKLCFGHSRVRQGEFMFNMAAMAMGDKNYVDALYLFKELYTVVEEAKRLLEFPTEAELETSDFISGKGPLWRDIKMLMTDIRIHTALGEALKEIHDGDKVLKEGIEGYDSLKLELVYNALDKYRLAVTLARGEDIEIMCIAYTKIARIYIDVFKDGIHKTKAKEYLNDVMDLSKVMTKNLYTEDWYRDATKFFKDMQDEKQRKEDELWQNQRKVFMDQLSEEVKELKSHEEDTDRQFLVFLFGKFPPKHRQESEWKHLVPKDEDDGMSMKKRMMKLVTIYHPDRVDKTVHSSKYHVLCEEITKELTNRYNMLKC